MLSVSETCEAARVRSFPSIDSKTRVVDDSDSVFSGSQGLGVGRHELSCHSWAFDSPDLNRSGGGVGLGGEGLLSGVKPRRQRGHRPAPRGTSVVHRISQNVGRWDPTTTLRRASAQPVSTQAGSPRRPAGMACRCRRGVAPTSSQPGRSHRWAPKESATRRGLRLLIHWAAGRHTCNAGVNRPQQPRFTRAKQRWEQRPLVAGRCLVAVFQSQLPPEPPPRTPCAANNRRSS
jgi:hypothetical protein